MASKGIESGLVLVLVVMLCGGATAQSSCSSALMGLSPCLNYVTGNSSTPSSSCCSQLGNVVQSQPRCLCSLLNGGGASLGITINQTLALALPGACNVQTPPLSQCNAANGPTASAATPESSPIGSPAATPASSPIGSPTSSSNETPEILTTPSNSNIPTTPSNSNIPSGGGSKTVPSTDGASDGSSIKVPLHLVVFALSLVSCASTFTRF